MWDELLQNPYTEAFNATRDATDIDGDGNRSTGGEIGQLVGTFEGMAAYPSTLSMTPLPLPPGTVMGAAAGLGSSIGDGIGDLYHHFAD